MNPASNTRPGGRESPRGAQEADATNKQAQPADATPGTDMQGADAGTAASGNERSGTPAQSVMKQEQKTDSERGSGR